MKNSNRKANTLIKKRNLIKMLRGRGIKRANKQALSLIEASIKEILTSTLCFAKQNMEIHGRKTLRSEDIRQAFKFKNNEKSFEV
jgi:histone H3/H4